MTETQAHKFVARWNWLLIPKKARMETEAIRAAEQFFGSIEFILILACFHGPNFLQIPFGLLFIFVALLYLRLEKARRVLDQYRKS